jgi:hypothetical protein
MRDGADLEQELVVLSTDIAPVLAERSLHLQHVGADPAFDGDLGGGGNEKVDRLRLHHLEGGTVQGTGHAILGLEELVHAAQRQRRHDRQAQHRFEWLAQGPGLVPMDPTVLACQHHHAGPVGRLDHDPIRADVVDAGLRIAGDPDGAAEVGRDIGAWIGDRYWELVDSPTGPDATSRDDHLLHGRFLTGDFHRFDGVGLRIPPLLEDAVGRVESHGRRIDLRRGTFDAYGDRSVECAPTRVGQVLEQPALTLRRLEPAELPTNKGHHLGVLVHETGDVNQEIAPVQLGQIFPDVPVERSIFGSLVSPCCGRTGVRD